MRKQPFALALAYFLAAALTSTASRAEPAMAAAPSAPAGKNMLWNSAFDAPALRPWTVGFDSPKAGHAEVTNGELCIHLTPATAASTPTAVTIRQRPLALAVGHHYQLRFVARATHPTRVRPRLTKIDPPYTELWAATADVSPDRRPFSVAFDGAVNEDNVELAIDLAGGGTVCFDDVELNDPQADIPTERLHPRAIPKLRVNQLGYLPELPKIATLATTDAKPLAWQLLDATGKLRAHGQTRPFGDDRSSGERVHQIDFSSATAPGNNLKLRVGADESVPFAIGRDIYRRLKYDALAFFYLQRSGVPIAMPYAGSRAYGRAAGHPGDKRVGCPPDAPCAYQLDVSGGWYDAGDHGKYVVNGGLTVWLLQNQYELLSRLGSTVAGFGDGKMRIPESKNGRPDLLDEARFGLDVFLRMQVPAGQPLAGMVHQKIHGEKWSPIPTLPDRDPIRRFLRPVSTAATLNLAAVAAQAARLWKPLDPGFAARCLAAAEAAFAAAARHPLARADRPGEGGGAYGDGDVEDERFWAAAELYVTTAKPEYKDALTRSRFYAPASGAVAASAIGWDHVAPLGKVSLLVAPNGLGDAALGDQRRQMLAGADRLLGLIATRGYRVPMASDRIYIWGSNGDVLNGGVVLGVAYALSHDPKYAGGVVDVMDYILGRNPLGFSYVAGYGTYAMRNPHHRVWAHMKDASLPEAPPGAVAGGPNSALQDPYIRKLGMGGCPPETCYVDNTDSYSTNEVAINWNAALAWDAALLDDIGNTAGRR